MTAGGDAGAIEDVSTTLADLLEGGIEMESLNVVVSSPDDVSNVNSPTLGLFLYDVRENPHESSLRPEEVSPDEVRPGPLVVDLRYLVTAYASGGGNETSRARRQHRLLGEAMRVLRDAAIVRGSALRGSLEGELRVSTGDGEETILDVWSTFQDRSYLPSVAYTVGPVRLGEAPVEDAGRVEALTRRGEDG